MGFDEMSAYDRAAWDACLKAVYDSRVRRLVPSRVRELTGVASKIVSAGYEKAPGHEQADWVLDKAFDGGMALTFRPALRTVRPDSVVRRVSARHPSVTKLSDLRGLSLEECDMLRRSGLGWTSMYGYDVGLPEEELFALGVMSLASASTLSGKTAAMASLSRLTQQMMRRAAWAQLRCHWLVNAIDQAYKALGFTLTKKKLAQAVPVAGAVLNAGVNAGLVNRTFRRAEAAYRLRFLSEKYDIDPAEWRRDLPAGSDEAEDVVQVDEELEAEIERDQGSESPLTR